MHYDVVVASFRLNAGETPGKVLERVLGLNAAQAKALLHRFPAVVVSHVDKGEAEHLLALLEAAGAKAAVRESAAVAELSASAPPVGFLPERAPTPSLPTPSLASSVPPEESPAESSMAWAPPFEAEQLSGQLEGAMTAYQLGDLDLGSSPVSRPPKARAAQAAPAAAKPAPAKPAPAKQGAGSSGAGPSSDGMQMFGSGFDDMQTPAPALELDRASRWRGDNTVGLHKTQGSGRARMASANALVQTRVVKPASFRDGWGESIWELFKFALGATIAVSVVLGIVFFIRDREATAELCGLSEPPTTEELTEQIMTNGARLAEMKSDGHRKADWSTEDMQLTMSTSDALLHPLLRLAPNIARPFVAQPLRVFVSDVEEATLEGLSQNGLGRHVDCLLVRHDPSDLRGRDAAHRVATLLRTGYVLGLPPAGEQLLVNEMARKHGRDGAKARFTPLCLAL